MNLKNTVLSLLDIFRLEKGQKIVKEPAVPLAPLLQRLDLPPIPSDHRNIADRVSWVIGSVRERFPQKISRRVLGKITRYYCVDLRGYGFFWAMPGRSNMLQVLSVRH